MNSKNTDAIRELVAGRTKIGPKGIANIKEATGLSSGVKSALRDMGVGIKGFSSGSSSSSSSSSTSLPEYGFGSFEGFTPAEFDAGLAIELQNLSNSAGIKIANINANASKKLQNSINRTNIKVAKIDERKEKAVQEIINAGARDVENIRGGYGLKGKAIDRGTSIYSGLVNAFSFN